MSKNFDSKTLGRLKKREEIHIVTRPPGAAAKHRVPIWVVVVNGALFVRSFTGPKGRWYQNIRANPEGDVELDGTVLHVKAVPISDPSSIEAVSQAYLQKYRDSPYAKDMVRSEVLPTTLRLEPA